MKNNIKKKEIIFFDFLFNKISKKIKYQLFFIKVLTTQ